jgi:hypothetical protein
MVFINIKTNLLIKYPLLPDKINKFSNYFIKNEELEYINNGEVIYTKSIKDLLQNYKKNDKNIDKNIENNFNIIIYTDNKNKNKKVFNDIPSVYNYEESEFKFILIEIMINNEILKIDFKTNEYNYMIVDNIINKDFIIYFLKKHYEKYVKTVFYYGGKLDNYRLKILDQNVNEILLDKNNCLTIKKNNYELFLNNVN